MPTGGRHVECSGSVRSGGETVTSVEALDNRRELDRFQRAIRLENRPGGVLTQAGLAVGLERLDQLAGKSVALVGIGGGLGLLAKLILPKQRLPHILLCGVEIVVRLANDFAAFALLLEIAFPLGVLAFDGLAFGVALRRGLNLAFDSERQNRAVALVAGDDQRRDERVPEQLVGAGKYRGGVEQVKGVD